MQVVILAGGFGTRISEHTELVPKPMLPVGGKPMLWHIMQWYAQFGHTEFVIALGYKEEVIRNYFLDFYMNSSDIEVNLQNGETTVLQSNQTDWTVRLISTGLNTMTGGRLKRLRSYIRDETFMFTYGDGVSNIDLHQLLRSHRESNSIATVSAVRPTARFGELKIAANKVLSFDEKPQIESGWINGGFMVLEPDVFDYIAGDETMFEREPLSRIADEGKLSAYLHDGFWQCIDTKREYDRLEEIYRDSPPWIKRLE
jgi:glucose-1-phosphate cytidylyltransferase